MNQLPKLLIILTALFFLMYGVAFALFPTALLSWVTDGQVDSSSALIDLRATYGGMSLAIGVMLLLSARNPHWHRLGLITIVVLMLCMAGGRTLGLVLDGSPNVMMWVYLALEVTVAMIALLLLRRKAG